MSIGSSDSLRVEIPVDAAIIISISIRINMNNSGISSGGGGSSSSSNSRNSGIRKNTIFNQTHTKFEETKSQQFGNSEESSEYCKDSETSKTLKEKSKRTLANGCKRRLDPSQSSLQCHLQNQEAFLEAHSWR